MVVATQNRFEFQTSEEIGIHWEDAPCPLCGNELWQSVLDAADNDASGRHLRFSVVQCGHCSLWYTNPRPSPDTIGQFYTDDYQPHRVPQGGRVKNSLLQRSASRLVGRPCPERHYLPMHGKGRLLDFGCGGGEFLLRMRDQGWNVAGLDVSKKVIHHLRNGYGIQAHVGTLPHADLAPDFFDVITMWAVLEHVHQPLAVLREAYRLLAPGGRLYVQVPNVESWDRRLFGAHWFSLDVPRHLTHFSGATLAMMLETAGFRTNALRQVSHPSATRKSVSIAGRAGALPLSQRLLGFKPFCLTWSWLAYVAGAGNHLFAFAERPAS